MVTADAGSERCAVGKLNIFGTLIETVHDDSWSSGKKSGAGNCVPAPALCGKLRRFLSCLRRVVSVVVSVMAVSPFSIRTSPVLVTSSTSRPIVSLTVWLSVTVRLPTLISSVT